MFQHLFGCCWEFSIRVYQQVLVWSHDHANAIVSCLCLLVAVGTIIYQVFQGERPANPSEIDIWTASNVYRQHCQHMHDKGKRSDNCDEALASPLLPPPGTKPSDVSQADQLLPLDRSLFGRGLRSTEENTGSIVALTGPRSTETALRDSMAYLPVLLIITVLLYVVLFLCVKRRRSRKRWSLHNGSGRRMPEELAAQILPLQTSTSEPCTLVSEGSQWTHFKNTGEVITPTNQVLFHKPRWYTPNRDLTPRRRLRRPYKYPQMVHDASSRLAHHGNPKDDRINLPMEPTT